MSVALCSALAVFCRRPSFWRSNPRATFSERKRDFLLWSSWPSSCSRWRRSALAFVLLEVASELLISSCLRLGIVARDVWESHDSILEYLVSEVVSCVIFLVRWPRSGRKSAKPQFSWCIDRYKIFTTAYISALMKFWGRFDPELPRSELRRSYGCLSSQTCIATATFIILFRAKSEDYPPEGCDTSEPKTQ